MNPAATAHAIASVADDDGDATTIGKDILELLSTAMYVEPLTIYREYVQNAADAIDEAHEAGLLSENDPGVVSITLDPGSRRIVIRDNGIGVPAETFAGRMRSLGSSRKRGTKSRGFRGVGRLAGLAYGQRLTFRSRSSADEPVMELAWDGRRLRAAMKDHEVEGLSEFIDRITTLSIADGEWPDRFFEVEILGVVRQGDDRLLREESVVDYLAQVAPVGYSPEFALSSEISSFLAAFDRSPDLRIVVNERAPVTRPHRDSTPAGDKPPIALRGLQTFEIPGLDGGSAAFGWVAHHDYDGAIPTAALIKGLRVRIGGIQVGGSSLLEEIFPEARFSSWAVGEINIVDPRIVPNGRRDNFEQNGHVANLLNHLSPIARDIARRCRTSSADRQRRRTFELQASALEQQLDVLEQGALSDAGHASLLASTSQALIKLEKLGHADVSNDHDADAMRARTVLQRKRLRALCNDEEGVSSPLDQMDPVRRRVYQDIIGLIYQCSSNQTAAKLLVDRIMERLA